ncbi:MAG: type II secretion system protein [Puniceicoccales bacterium]
MFLLPRNLISPSSLNTRSQRAFSLVELLVVIAVIGILAGITFSILGSTRDQARLTTSLSNIRNLHAANTLYANEHGGHYVPILSRDDEGTLTRWLENETFRSYLGIGEDADWPENLISPNAGVLDSNGNPRSDRSYAMNITGLTGYSTPGNQWQMNVFEVKNPEKTIAMTDALDWIVSYYGAKKYNGEEVSSGSTVAYRYNDKAAIIYFDGHTEAKTMDEISENPDIWFLED